MLAYVFSLFLTRWTFGPIMSERRYTLLNMKKFFRVMGNVQTIIAVALASKAVYDGVANSNKQAEKSVPDLELKLEPQSRQEALTGSATAKP